MLQTSPTLLMRASAKDRAEYYSKAAGSGGSGWMAPDGCERWKKLNPMGGAAAQRRLGKCWRRSNRKAMMQRPKCNLRGHKFVAGDGAQAMSFTGGAVFGNVGSYGGVIEAGAFSNSWPA